MRIVPTASAVFVCTVVLLWGVDWAVARTLGNVPVSVHPKTLKLVDEHFREVYFHGVNVVVKGFPWVPDINEFNPLTSFAEKDMQTLEDLGLNSIRLGTMWPGIEPTNGTYNSSYVQTLYTLIQRAAKHDIYSLLDMHQDVLSEKFCGEGFPLWATIPDNNSQFPEPAGPPYPVNNDSIPSYADCHSKGWADYYFTTATGTAFQNFYSNKYGIRDKWSQAWAYVAKQLGPLGSAILGYELLNEPWSGDATQDILLMLPGVADEVNLQPTWEAGAAAIRAADTTHAIWFEGVTWDWFNVGFTDVPGGPAWRNKSVLSYHFYEPPDFNIDTQFSARQDDMKRLGCGGYLTEFYMQTSVMDKCDELGQGWMIWEYKPFVHKKTGWATSIWFDNGTMNMEFASNISRTYAQHVAGVTQVAKYEHMTKRFVLIYAVDTTYVTSNSTLVYFNQAMHYPNGYTVVATSTAGPGAVKWVLSSTNHITVTHNAAVIGNGGLVTVELSPK